MAGMYAHGKIIMGYIWSWQKKSWDIEFLPPTLTDSSSTKQVSQLQLISLSNFSSVSQ